MQSDLFEKDDELAILKRELYEVKERAENARKGLFARHNELIKLYMQLKDEMDHMKAIQANKPNKVELIPFFTGVIEKY
jgi:hypothetical protein